MPDAPAALIEVMEDLASPQLFAEACGVCAGKNWYFGNRSNDAHDIPFWKMDLDGVAVYDEIWKAAQARCEALAGCKLRVIRQYANGHTYGLGGQPHLDDLRPGTFTLLYYPMLEWDPSWQGETVFHDQTGEIAVAVTPRPNRAVLFDARIPHAGRAPSRSCPALRVTVAYKLEAVPSSAKAEPAPVKEPVRSTVTSYIMDEISRDGTQRSYRVTSSVAQMNAMIDERLAELGKTLRMPGYRPGKIPTEVLATRYGTKARTEVIKRVGEQAAAEILEQGGLTASLDLLQGAESGEVVFQLSATHLPELAEPNAEKWSLVKLTAPAGSSDDISAMLTQDLHRQVLDRLHDAYDFPIAAPLIDQELGKILKTLPLPADEAEKTELLAELHDIAERRVRLGAVLVELARRHRLVTKKNDAALEQRVIDWFLSQAEVSKRPATDADLAALG